MTDRTMPLPTLLDNRDDHAVLQALKRLLPEARSLDVATGTFEIGSLLALDSYWNALQTIRLLMGDETTKRTRNELVQSLRVASDESIEREKERDDSLSGLEAIRNAIETGVIQTKVYIRAKFHSKAMLMKMKPPHLQHRDFRSRNGTVFARPPYALASLQASGCRGGVTFRVGFGGRWGSPP